MIQHVSNRHFLSLLGEDLLNLPNWLSAYSPFKKSVPSRPKLLQKRLTLYKNNCYEQLKSDGMQDWGGTVVFENP